MWCLVSWHVVPRAVLGVLLRCRAWHEGRCIAVLAGGAPGCSRPQLPMPQRLSRPPSLPPSRALPAGAAAPGAGTQPPLWLPQLRAGGGAACRAGGGRQAAGLCSLMRAAGREGGGGRGGVNAGREPGCWLKHPRGRGGGNAGREPGCWLKHPPTLSRVDAELGSAPRS